MCLPHQTYLYALCLNPATCAFINVRIGLHKRSVGLSQPQAINACCEVDTNTKQITITTQVSRCWLIITNENIKQQEPSQQAAHMKPQPARLTDQLHFRAAGAVDCWSLIRAWDQSASPISHAGSEDVAQVKAPILNKGLHMLICIKSLKNQTEKKKTTIDAYADNWFQFRFLAETCGAFPLHVKLS